MRLLELFCGTKSIGKEFEKVGFDVVSLDFDAQFEPTFVRDILTVPADRYLDEYELGTSPDVQERRYVSRSGSARQ